MPRETKAAKSARAVENSDELLRLSLGHSSSGLLRKADGSNRCAKASNYDMIR